MLLQLFHSLLHTIVMRPYVFMFLTAFLIIGTLNRGIGRTLIFLAMGFLIAFLSEVSSIRNGFPYGPYRYVYENLSGELILLGVPLWDSLSYSFLAYAAYEMTDYFFRGMKSLPFIMLAACMMVLLDLAADPLAVLGDRWFLGKIFYYEKPGFYFGVPFSNFAGWFLVALCIFSAYSFLEKRWVKMPEPLRASYLGPLFYWGILAFNFAITLWIGEFALALTGIGIHLSITSGLLLYRRRIACAYSLRPSSRYEPAVSKCDEGS